MEILKFRWDKLLVSLLFKARTIKDRLMVDQVVKLMGMLGTLNQLDPSIGADFVKKQAEEANGKK